MQQKTHLMHRRRRCNEMKDKRVDEKDMEHSKANTGATSLTASLNES